MHTSQCAKLSVAIVWATVWSVCVFKGQSLRLHDGDDEHSDGMSQIMEQEPAFNRDCKPFPNKRIILVTPNEEYWDIFMNWYHHAAPYMGSNDQLVVVAQDEGALTRLRKSSFTFMDLNGTLHHGGKALSLHKKAPWGTPKFYDVTLKRPGQILHFLEQGCTVLYNDVDAAWLGNVFEDIAKAGSHDIYITDDSRDNNTFRNVLNGSLIKKWYFCDCFLYLQPSPQIVELVQNWTQVVSKGLDDQSAFNHVLKVDYNSRKTVDFGVLPYGAFPPGSMVDHGLWKKGGVHVLHANYHPTCETKKKFMEKHNAWKV